MRRLALTGAALVALAMPAVAHGGIKRHYTHAYYTARNHQHAHVGRNIRRDGLRKGVEAHTRDYVKSLAVLNRMIHPPQMIQPQHASVSPGGSAMEASASGSGGGGGGWAIPSRIVQCESSGQNLAPNSATASGYYQIIDSTWKANGGSTASANQASKAEQSAVASRIWAGGAGAGQWVCK
jgi:hypothetical protein